MAEVFVTSPAEHAEVEWAEVQRVLLSGFPKLGWARFLFARVTEPRRAARFRTRCSGTPRIRTST